MAKWKITPDYKKSIVECQEWQKDGNTLYHSIGWRWGEFIVVSESDEQPELGVDPDMFDLGQDLEVDSWETSDGCWEENETDDCDEETTEWLQEFLARNSIFDLEEHGWICVGCTMTLEGEYTVERVEE